MKSAITALSRIVEVDQKINSLQEELDELPVRVREVEEQLAKILSEYEAKSAEKNKVEAELKKSRQSIEVETEGLKTKEERLHGIKTQKEYQAVLKEIATLKTALKDDEKNLNDKQAQIETMAAEVNPLEEKVQALRKELEQEQGSIQELVAKLKDQIKDLEDQRSAALLQLPEDIQQKFMRIRKSRQPAAVVVDGGTCQGCYIQIPPQLYIEIKKLVSICQCPNCHRLLYPKVEIPA